jgi:hypothetical protein
MTICVDVSHRDGRGMGTDLIFLWSAKNAPPLPQNYSNRLPFGGGCSYIRYGKVLNSV